MLSFAPLPPCPVAGGSSAALPGDCARRSGDVKALLASLPRRRNGVHYVKLGLNLKLLFNTFPTLGNRPRHVGPVDSVSPTKYGEESCGTPLIRIVLKLSPDQLILKPHAS